MNYREHLEKNGGVLRFDPIFIPRQFGDAGRRLRIHPDDYYAYGVKRGSVKERWFSSVIAANNGPLAEPDEGMSRVNTGKDRSERVYFKDFVDALGADLIGKKLYDKYGTWPMYSKFYDYTGPLFFHLHLDFESAARVGRIGKPEAYYYPPQYNNYPGKFPHTYFGFDPDTTKEQVKDRLLKYESGDNRITELSRAFRIELGTGWYTPPGVLHAPGSYLTYEPQWNSDVNSVYENITDGEIYDYKFLCENCPEDKMRDIDYIMSLMDWNANVDPHYKKTYFRPPVTLEENEDYVQKQVAYGNDYIAARELTVFPGKTVTVKDGFAYGLIITQGFGKLGSYDCSTACMLRVGGVSQDEFFVSEKTATEGLTITNKSDSEPLVMLKHYPAYSDPAAIVMGK